MIHLYFWNTPNGYKPLLFLEESRLEYAIKPVNIGIGRQFDADFLRIAPNNKIPAIVDHTPSGGGEPVTLFESGAILQYLSEKTGRFLPDALAGRAEALKWLHWQIGGLGPILGQALHFGSYADRKLPYAIARFQDEADRLYGVLDRNLTDREFIAGDDYSIADMASFPWIHRVEQVFPRLDTYRNVARWCDRVAGREAVRRAYRIGEAIMETPTAPPVSEERLTPNA